MHVVAPSGEGTTPRSWGTLDGDTEHQLLHEVLWYRRLFLSICRCRNNATAAHSGHRFLGP